MNVSNFDGFAETSDLTSRSLVARLKTNDAEAWDRLVELYGPLVYHWCRKCGLSGADAADLMQETFQRVFQAIASFRRDRAGDTFRGWLWTITRNVIRDHARKHKNQQTAVGGTEMHQFLAQVPEDGPPPDDDSSSRAESHLIQSALALIRSDFQESSWIAFKLTVLDGYSSTEAAAELGMSAEAVRQAKSRVLRRVREELGELGE